ncbi:hypothetical protein EIP91_007986 [Steccherinum ochraceum]|uniref:Cytochrome P450 n=1 Tax=Steccherinum ochraceum TaxID=92696 RepID=A0A4V2MVB1_9APHY|nr:hypothetical protein EIP91_007986 [Steccherinum ochraceum]
MAFTVLLLAALAASWLIVVRARRSRLPLPPGPRPWPVIGSVFDMPAQNPWVTYRQWYNRYDSDIIYVQLPLQPAIILGTYKAAIDLLDKRSNIYSSRMSSVMHELTAWDFNIGLMPYGPRWRHHRRMFHQHFHQGVVDRFRPVQLRMTRDFLSWALKNPEHTRKLVRQLFTAIIFDVAYGKRISGMNDEYVVTAEEALASLAAAPGVYWIEYGMPLLKHIPSWVPGMKSKKTAEKVLPLVLNMKDTPYAEVKAEVDKTTAPPSLARTMIENIRSRYGGTPNEVVYDEVAKNVAGIAYAAAAETTTSSAQSFLLAMAMFPDVQKKAQAELDKVVGPDRLPDYDDIEQVTYIRALVLETMRWLPAAAAGVPHALIADDEYKGYHIPKGSVVIPDAWAMLHNPADYPKPEQFKPERYLDQHGNIDSTVMDPTIIAFGFGRRICPGRHFSNNSLAIFIASTLQVFDISAGLDDHGTPVELSNEVIGGLIIAPRVVPCGLKPRSEAAIRLILEAQTAEEL